MGRYLKSHLKIGLGYWLLLMVNWWLNGRLGAEWQNGLWLGVGVLIGVYLLFLDRLVYVYTYPQEQLSQHFAYLWRQNKYRQALELLDSRRTEQQRLMLRSALFMGFWLLLAIFSLTSSLSMVGRGAVMGMMAHVLFDSWRLQKLDPEKLNKRLFWPIKRTFSREEQMWLLIIMTVLFGVLSLWI